MILIYSYLAELTAVVINPLIDEPKWGDAAKVSVWLTHARLMM